MDSWFDWAILVLTLVTVLVQVYAVALSHRISPKELRVYRYFLCTCTLLDMAYTVSIGLGLTPRFMFPGCFAAEIRGFFKLLGPAGGKIGVITVMYIVGMMLFFEEYSLAYRFTLIQQRFPRLDEKLTNWQLVVLLICLVSGVLCGGIWLRGEGCVIVPDLLPPTATIAGQTPLPFSLSNGTCYTGAFPWWPARNQQQQGQGVVLVAADLDFIRSPLTLVLAALAGSVAILVTVASAVAIIYQLRANAANYSPQSYRQHVQLIRLVILQLILPAVFLLFPVILAAHFVLNGGTRNPPIFVGQMGLLLILAYAFGNAVLMVFSLATYRRFTLALLRGRWADVRLAWKAGSIDVWQHRQRQQQEAVVAFHLHSQRRRQRALSDSNCQPPGATVVHRTGSRDSVATISSNGSPGSPSSSPRRNDGGQQFAKVAQVTVVLPGTTESQSRAL